MWSVQEISDRCAEVHLTPREGRGEESVVYIELVRPHGLFFIGCRVNVYHSRSNYSFARREFSHNTMPSYQEVAIVVGASRGIGRQIAVDLAKDGYAGKICLLQQ